MQKRAPDGAMTPILARKKCEKNMLASQNWPLRYTFEWILFTVFSVEQFMRLLQHGWRYFDDNIPDFCRYA